MTGTIDFRTPGAGFDQPVEMWLACHERVQRFAVLLGRLAEHLGARGADEDAQVTATSIRRYFNEAAPRHHEDEEVDMFPRLRERLDGERDKVVLDVLDQVEADHLEMAGVWKRLDATLAEIARGKAATLDRPLIDRFATMYRHHIDAEERVILPALRKALGKADWQAVGRAMAERRGLEWEQVEKPPGRRPAGRA
ncbi:MAG: hemerythrin domain-containing protein [Betaproteobacteria bacterium]